MPGFRDTSGKLDVFESREDSRVPAGALESRESSSYFNRFFCRFCSSLSAFSSGRISRLIASSTAWRSLGLLIDVFDIPERIDSPDFPLTPLTPLISDGFKFDSVPK
jgi:hypothetical protein